MIRIMGDNGAELAVGLLNTGEGRRHVVAEIGDFCLRGNLQTRWQDGERRWEIRLRTAATGDPADHQRLQDVPVP
ncbi:hypothetical protein J0H33_07375 [bacterium]|nr:hypothetical protein [bacterium]